MKDENRRTTYPDGNGASRSSIPARRQFKALQVGRLMSKKDADNELVLNADQVAEFLGLDRKTVYEAAGRGEIPHRRVGRRFLFSKSAIVTWLDSCRPVGHR